MKTTFNANAASWLPEVQALWDARVNPDADTVITNANFFTARPWRNEYDRGSTREGFVFTVLEDGCHHVCQAQWPVAKPTPQQYARLV